MAKENFDSWERITDFEPTSVVLDLGVEEVFQPSVNKQNSEPTRPTKCFTSFSKYKMHTIFEKNKQKKNTW